MIAFRVKLSGRPRISKGRARQAAATARELGSGRFELAIAGRKVGLFPDREFAQDIARLSGLQWEEVR
jgi:hypothetical protein